MCLFFALFFSFGYRLVIFVLFVFFLLLLREVKVAVSLLWFVVLV